jgi:hypothetical protein
MPILEDVKEYMQRATGLRRPGKKEAPDLTRPSITVAISVDF